LERSLTIVYFNAGCPHVGRSPLKPATDSHHTPIKRKRRSLMVENENSVHSYFRCFDAILSSGVLVRLHDKLGIFPPRRVALWDIARVNSDLVVKLRSYGSKDVSLARKTPSSGSKKRKLIDLLNDDEDLYDGGNITIVVILRAVFIR